KTQCSNQLHQLGIALHNLYDSKKVLPPIAAAGSSSAITVEGPYKGAIGFTIFSWLLPFVEQTALYNAANLNVNTAIPGSPGAGTVYATPVPAYKCPSDPTTANGLGQTTNGGANSWATSNYAANYFVFGNPSSPTSVTTRREAAKR